MRKIEKEKLREKLAKWQFSKISIRTKSENSRFVKINPCEKKNKTDSIFRYFDYHYTEDILSVKLQIVGSESI